MKQSFLHQLFPEFKDVIVSDYPHQFRMLADGLLQCLSCPTRFYDFDDVRTDKVITALVGKASLYLIATVDGLYKGVLIEYWECHS